MFDGPYAVPQAEHVKPGNRFSGRRGILLLALALGVIFTGRAWSRAPERELSGAFSEAAPNITLEAALAASEYEGRPLSARFDVKDGQLYLSVYTTRDERFTEVIVDYRTGKVILADPITAPSDFFVASMQRDAMAYASVSLRKAVMNTVKANHGYQAVSVTPSMLRGRPVAYVVLLKGFQQWKFITEELGYREALVPRPDTSDVGANS